MADEYTADKLHDSKKVTLSDDRIVDNLNVTGHVTQQPDYKFEAKVFDIGSKSGIDGGRISGLRVVNGEKIVLEYSRGWAKGQEPETHTPEQKRVLSEIKAGFPETQYLKDKAEQEKTKSNLTPRQQSILDRANSRGTVSRDTGKER